MEGWLERDTIRIMLNFLGFNLLSGWKKGKPHHALQGLFDHERNLCERVGWDLCPLVLQHSKNGAVSHKSEKKKSPAAEMLGLEFEVKTQPFTQ